MVTNSFGNKKFHAAGEKAQHALMRGTVFSFQGWGGGGGVGRNFLFFSMFPSDSLKVPQVPKLFPKTFPTAPQF
jgi:hypothetical protein